MSIDWSRYKSINSKIARLNFTDPKWRSVARSCQKPLILILALFWIDGDWTLHAQESEPSNSTEVIAPSTVTNAQPVTSALSSSAELTPGEAEVVAATPGDESVTGSEPMIEIEEPPAVVTDRTIVDLGESPDRVTFTFQEAPWAEVLREFASWSGLTLDLTDTPPGYFNYFDNRPHSASEAIDILNGYLLPRGYVILRRDKFLVALKTSNEMLSNLIPTIVVEDLDERGDNELVKIVVPVNELSPVIAAEEIRGLLGPFGQATPLESSQSVVLQGFGRGLRQGLSALQNSRPPLTDDKLDFRSFPLESLPVLEAEAQIRKLFGLASPTAPANVSGARSEIDREAYYRTRGSRDSRDGDRERVEPPIPLLKKVAMNMQVSSLERTNNLLVTATPEGLKLVEEILLAIDVAPSSESAAEWIASNEPELRVYRLSSADEGEVAKTLDVIMPGVVVNEDRRQDTIHILATPVQHEEVKELIDKLDEGDGGNMSVEVISLRRASPTAAATLLTSMFANVDRDERPMIQAEVPSRSLVVRGTTVQLDQIRQALVQFGEPAQSGLPQPSGNSRVRRITVGGRSAETIAGAAQRILSTDKAFQGSIRVVVPGQAKSEATSLPADDDTTRTDIQPSRKTSEAADLFDGIDGSTSIPSISSLPAIASVVRRSSDSNHFASVSVRELLDTNLIAKSTASTSERTPPSMVSIEVRGDELLVYSGDAKLLDSVESMIRELVDQMPDRTRWTIFYLKVAEAEKAAAKLTELLSNEMFPDVTGLMMSEIEQLPLRIIADKRTNALFISGSESQVSQAESFLEYIDAAEVPGSFLRREPHAIKVEYADVDEIAELLRGLYRDHLVDPVAERQRNERDRDGRSSRDRDDDRDRNGSSRSSSNSNTNSEESVGIRLTLAVDRKTGELLVACNDQLFAEIEAVVRQRDLAVRDSEQTVEFIRLPGDLPDNFLQMLDGLSEKVSIETIVSPEPDRSRSRDSSRPSSSRSSDRRDSSR